MELLFLCYLFNIFSGSFLLYCFNHLFDLQGFNSTLTEPVESSGRRGGDQIKEMELKLHPELKGSLATLCSDPKTTIIVLSGSDRSVLDDVKLCH